MAFACFLDEDQKAQLRVSKAIDTEFKTWKKEAGREFKLLLLGTGEAGKSTFIKQMRIIHGQGYSDADRAEFRPLIYRNIIAGIQILIQAMSKLKIDYTNPSNKAHAESLVGISENINTITTDNYTAIRSIWADRGIKTCFARRREFQISDSAKYYFEALERIKVPDYIPSIDDVLRVRVPTTGIIEYTFQMRKDVVFRMLDVGGQRSERRKWIHCFDDVKAIIFLTAINEYDQVLVEDEAQNRLRESLALFECLFGYPYFKKSSMILFLNKTDLFEEKIATSHLSDYFPYNGPKASGGPAKDFIKDMFNNLNPNPENQRVFAHFTEATDTKNIERVFTAVREHVLEENLKDYNLM